MRYPRRITVGSRSSIWRERTVLTTSVLRRRTRHDVNIFMVDSLLAMQHKGIVTKL
jgi:hypothetical protein